MCTVVCEVGNLETVCVAACVLTGSGFLSMLSIVVNIVKGFAVLIDVGDFLSLLPVSLNSLMVLLYCRCIVLLLTSSKRFVRIMF